MKKLLPLLPALLCLMFAAGCGISDDALPIVQDDTKQANLLSAYANVRFPAGDIDVTNLTQAAVRWQGITVKLGGLELWQPTTYSSSGGYNQLTFRRENFAPGAIQRDANDFAELQIHINGTLLATASVKVTSTVPYTYSGSSAAMTANIQIEPLITGNYNVSITYSTPISNGTLSTDVSRPVQGAVLLVEGMEYEKNGAWKHLNGATDVPAQNTKLRVRFNVPVENALTNFSINAQGTVGNVILTHNSIGPDLSAQLSDDEKTVTFSLAGSNAERLKSGSSYTLTFNNAGVHKKGDSSVTLHLTTGTSVVFITQ